VSAPHEAVALLFAQAQTATPNPTPDPLHVTLVDEGKAWWRDFVVPVATLTAALVGGIGGVVIGGRMNRTTMTKLEADRAEVEDRLEKGREERETRLEKGREARETRLEKGREERETRLDTAKAERERRLDETRAARSLAADRRLAIGSLRLLNQELARVRAVLRNERDAESDDPTAPAVLEATVRLRPEDKHAIATWIPSDDWPGVSETLEWVDAMAARRVHYRSVVDRAKKTDADTYRAVAGAAFESVSATVETIRRVIERLAEHSGSESS
jgi:hypothetical protein